MAGSQYVLLNKSGTGSSGREGEEESAVLVDLCERTKGRDRSAKVVGHFPASWPRGVSYLNPEINPNTPPSEGMELFLKMQAFALKLFQKPKI